MHLVAAIVVLLVAARSVPALAERRPTLPLPFSRNLQLVAPPLNGSDVTILQHLLQRSGKCPSSLTGQYDEATAHAVACFQSERGISADPPGVFGSDTASTVLRLLAADRWRDDGRSAAALGGYKYKILLPVHRNRSVETVGTLLDANNNQLLQFPARTHGHDCDATGQRIDGIPWPDLTDDGCPAGPAKQGCIGLNEFSSDGATPTGLTEIDLNSPEPTDDERLYGPYPVNRSVSAQRQRRNCSLLPCCNGAFAVVQICPRSCRQRRFPIAGDPRWHFDPHWGVGKLQLVARG